MPNSIFFSLSIQFSLLLYPRDLSLSIHLCKTFFERVINSNVDSFLEIIIEVFDCQEMNFVPLCKQVLSRPPACFLKSLSNVFPGVKGEPSLLSFKKKDVSWVTLSFLTLIL